MVGAKLYERGASAGQVMAFLIARPWNSIPLTLILVGLLGLGWTLAFIVLSLVIAVITGRAFDALESRSFIPSNPANKDNLATGSVANLASTQLPWRDLASGFDWSRRGILELLVRGIRGSRIALRWLAFGLVAAALIRAARGRRFRQLVWTQPRGPAVYLTWRCSVRGPC